MARKRKTEREEINELPPPGEIDQWEEGLITISNIDLWNLLKLIGDCDDYGVRWDHLKKPILSSDRGLLIKAVTYICHDLSNEIDNINKRQKGAK